VHLDALSLAGPLDAPLLVVLSGDEDAIADDAVLLLRCLEGAKVACAGVIVNKVQNKEEFCGEPLQRLERAGLKVLGVIPRYPELAHYTLKSLRDALLARVITGDKSLDRVVQHVFMGFSPTEAAVRSRDFSRPGLLLVAGGERSDLILAAIEGGAAGGVLTGDALPPASIIGLSAERGVPLLSVSNDSYQTARAITAMEPLLHLDDPGKLDLLEKMVREHVELPLVKP
jgi:BioD-like phosphotransacetylase family protein